jgi:purine-binding chemotaxis protein CheW
MTMTLLDLLKELELSIHNNYGYKDEIKNTGNRYFSFILNNEVYAIPVDRMEELIPLDHIIKTGEDREYKKGLARYKNGLIEIIDLRLRLNIKPKNYDGTSTIIVVNRKNDFAGLIVDDVIDFITFNSEDYFSNQKTDLFIQKIIKEDKAVIKILNLNNVLKFE